MKVNREDSTSSWNLISLNMGLVLGMMGMPHIMVRFLTVRDGRAARSSAQVAMWIFAVFFLLLPIFGYAATNEVGRDQIEADNPAGNAAAPALAQAVGGDVLFALGPDVLGDDDAIWPLSIPAIVTIPAGFALCWIGSRVGRGRAGTEGMAWEEFSARAFPSRRRDEARFEKGGIAERTRTTTSR